MARGSMMAKYVEKFFLVPSCNLPCSVFAHYQTDLNCCLQGSGHNFASDVWHPSHGYVNNCDGARSHWACDYRQQ